MKHRVRGRWRTKRDVRSHLTRLGKLRREIDLRLAAEFELHTDGKGLWSNEARKVQVTSFSVFPSGRAGGELRIYFTRRSWSVAKHGLIYTDNLFLKELKKMLEAYGYTAKALRGIHYSEQGMQGGVGFQMKEDYVSLDAGELFVAEHMDQFDGGTVYRIMSAEIERRDEMDYFWRRGPYRKRRQKRRRRLRVTEARRRNRRHGRK